MENKTCKQCNSNFTVTDEDLKFLEKISPEFGGRKYFIPAPTLCPDCRFQRRLAMRNRRNLFKRKSDLSGIDLVSHFPPNSKNKVYHVSEISDDKFEAMEYGREFDFSRTFFEQYQELFFAVPKMHASVVLSTVENAEFANGIGNVKNAYWCNAATNCENIYYCEGIYDSKDCYDCLKISKSNICYQCTSCSNVYEGFFSTECYDCRNIYFSFDLHGCQNCFGCVGLKNKQFYIFNVPYSKENYESFINNFVFSEESIKENLNKRQEGINKVPRKYSNTINSENCTGEYIRNCKNCLNCYDVADSENIKNGFALFDNSTDCLDISYYGRKVQNCYECLSVGLNAQNMLFSLNAYTDNSKQIYCAYCWPGCSNLFGCVGLKKKQYCILNKQYSEEEYEQLVPQIIEHMQKTGEWGEFFPFSTSETFYNISEAMDFFPLTKEQAIKQGSDWLEEDFGLKYDGPFYLPKEISEYDPKKNPKANAEIDELLKGILKCKVTGKPFRIIPQELAFYIEYKLPIPNKYYYQRFKERFNQLQPVKLYHRQCMCEESGHKHNGRCSNEFKTTYAPERTEKVYCEECYQKTMI